LAKYQRAIIIGVLSILFAGMIMMGVSYLNSKKDIDEVSLMNNEVNQIKLHDWDRCGDHQIIIGGGFC